MMDSHLAKPIQVHPSIAIDCQASHNLLHSKLYIEDLLFESKDISGLNIELLIIWDHIISV